MTAWGLTAGSAHVRAGQRGEYGGGFAAGATYYSIKPFRLVDLLECVSHFCLPSDRFSTRVHSSAWV